MGVMRCPNPTCGHLPAAVLTDFGDRLHYACVCGLSGEPVRYRGDRRGAVEAWKRAAEEHAKKLTALEAPHV